MNLGQHALLIIFLLLALVMLSGFLTHMVGASKERQKERLARYPKPYLTLTLGMC